VLVRFAMLADVPAAALEAIVLERPCDRCRAPNYVPLDRLTPIA
jgi:hypothetical protein